MPISINSQKIQDLLTRGVQKIYPSVEELEKVLLSGKKIRIYFGIDPTNPNLHLGHTIPLRKLRQFQDLNHEIIILIGDFTAQIGDPTGKDSNRKKLTHKQVLQNAEGYRNQIGKILDIASANMRFLHNEEWTNKLKPIDMLELASYFTVARLLERDMFQRRIKKGKNIYVHEFLYPIFQAYDSVTMDVDMEIGGSDQIFNMLAGRTLMRKKKNKEKFVLATKLLVDPTGKKMGKSENNMVMLNDKPENMFGKIMSWPDEQIIPSFELLTDTPMEEIKTSSKQLKNQSINPRNLKARLAKEIVALYHGENSAQKAEKEFNRVFKEKGTPLQAPVVKLKTGQYSILDLLVQTKMASSKSEAKRLVEQKAVEIDGVVVDDWHRTIKVKKAMMIRSGKRKFIQLQSED